MSRLDLLLHALSSPAFLAVIVTGFQLVIARAVLRAVRDYGHFAERFETGMKNQTDALLKASHAELAIHESNRRLALELLKIEPRQHSNKGVA